MSTVPEKIARIAQTLRERQAGGPVPTRDGSDPVPVKRVRVGLPCVHEVEGPPLEYCKTCHGQTAEGRHVRECELHEKCTRSFVSHLVRFCGRCPDYQPREGAEVVVPETPVPPAPITPIVPAPPTALRTLGTRFNEGRPLNRPVPASEARLRESTGGRLGLSRLRPAEEVMSVSAPASGLVRRRKWKRPPVWAYGLTTVPERRRDLLPRTLTSLRGGGFDRPTLFVDGDWDHRSWTSEFGLDVVCRYPRLRVYGNWILALAELYIRNAHADFYAIFQDDFVTSRNLRPYLESVEYPARGYLNLYTFPKNQALANDRVGFYKSNQKGKGAVALVFDRDAVTVLLAHNHMVKRVRDPHRGHKLVDGGVVETMRMENYYEYVHNPSLVQHLGFQSTTGNPKHPQAPSFVGEDYDLLKLLAVGAEDG